MILNFFPIFENGHYAADQVYFYESNSKKIREFCRALAGHARQSFHFQKITGTLKINICLKIFANKFRKFEITTY